METPLIILLIGLCFCLVYLFKKDKYEKLNEIGETVEGFVFETSDDIIINTSSDSSNTKAPIIRFITKKEEWVTEKSDIGFSYGMLKPGKKVVVKYNPENPKEFMMEKPFSSFFILKIFLVIGLVFVCAGIFQLSVNDEFLSLFKK